MMMLFLLLLLLLLMMMMINSNRRRRRQLGLLKITARLNSCCCSHLCSCWWRWRWWCCCHCCSCCWWWCGWSTRWCGRQPGQLKINLIDVTAVADVVSVAVDITVHIFSNINSNYAVDLLNEIVTKSILPTFYEQIFANILLPKKYKYKLFAEKSCAYNFHTKNCFKLLVVMVVVFIFNVVASDDIEAFAILLLMCCCWYCWSGRCCRKGKQNINQSGLFSP